MLSLLARAILYKNLINPDIPRLISTCQNVEFSIDLYYIYLPSRKSQIIETFIFIFNCSHFVRFVPFQPTPAHTKQTFRKAHWDAATESMVDSSFFWGYLITQIPGGFLASIFPANRIFGIAITTSALLNMIIPGAMSLNNVTFLLCIRVTQGLVEVIFNNNKKTNKIASCYFSLIFNRLLTLTFTMFPSNDKYRASSIQLAMESGDSGHRHKNDPGWQRLHSVAHMPALLLACQYPVS